jgi:gamma-glutamyltranspeptidase/glutathione hydrolase
MKRIQILIFTTILFSGCDSGNISVNRQPVEGHSIITDNGMVVSAHSQGSQTGVMVLQKGGNAVDAAVATGFALAVCYPAAGNIGGGGYVPR